MEIVLQDGTFKQLRDFIYEKVGIFIPDTKKYFLANKLLTRIRDENLRSFEDYLYLVKYSANGSELSRLYDSITTNETFFFREPQQFDILFNFVLPEITGMKKTKKIKLWSAACSTGEEAYTIVMMCAEKKPDIRMDVFASDISDAVLASAIKGVYNSYSVRNVPELYLKKYFRSHDQNYELDASVKNAVKFMNINLTNEKIMKSMCDMDVIFCRNVLIYFDDKAKQKVVSLLYDSLRPGGVLFTGSTESLHNITRAFKPTITNKVIVYRRT